MKLHKSFTTVTPFSKTLALILFVVFPFIGFYLGIQYQKHIDVGAQQTFTSTTMSKRTPSLPEISLSKDMKDWKWYRLLFYGVSFVIPPVQSEGFSQNLYNAQRTPVNPKAPDGCKSYGLYERSFIFNKPGDPSFGMALRIWLPMQKVADARSWFDACMKQIYIHATPHTTASLINGNDIFIVQFRDRENNFDRYLFTKNEIVYDFGFDSADQMSKTDKHQLMQILNSITFTQPTFK